MNTSISAIIPTYNRWPVVTRAIDSILAQTVQVDEIIVVDDGSTDNTANHLHHRYGEQIIIIEQKNHGVSAARNQGIEASTGNWIALLDSDDEWLAEKIELQLKAIEYNDDCVLCHTDEIWIRNGVRVNQMNKHEKSGGDIFEKCLPLCVISPSSSMIKREIFNSTGLFDTDLPACEDYDLWLRICATYKTDYLQDRLIIKYGGHEDQLSKKHWGMDRFRIRALQKLLAQSILNPAQRVATLNMLERKTGILLKGALKHRNQELTDECYSIFNQHQLSIPEALRC